MREEISFGTWLRQQRRALDLSQQAFADQVGCAEVTLRRIEAGRLKPSKDLANILLAKLGIPETERPIWISFARGLSEFPAKSPLTFNIPKSNLPASLTTFIGRGQEQTEIIGLITKNRLVTLAGTGGIGKTRLALEVGAELSDGFPDSVWFIDFAPLSDAALVPQSLLITLGLNEQVSRPALAIVSDFLQPKRALLILDNCEHLVQACARLVETLLHACPTLHILATSREALDISGEALYFVPTLNTPDPAKVDLETLPEYEAVQLFAQRAKTAWPGFKLTNDNMLAVARVCHQLDGIPLAIELAAARVKALQVEQIASRLESRFDFLTGGSRTALPRHQTLNGLIDWSYNLLSENERILLQRLSVFTGGCTLEAAEAVCAGEGIEAEAVLDLMTQLVNKSLVISEREQGQDARYRMLETIREYARDWLIEAGNREQIHGQHFEFFLQFAENSEPQIRGPQLPAYLNRLEAEHDNLRSALEWGLAQAEWGERSLRLAGALFSFWEQRSYVSEGRVWLARVLANPVATSVDAARAKVLYGAGCLAGAEGDLTAARNFLEESVEMWRLLGTADSTGLAHTLSYLGQIMRSLGDPATARALGDEAINLFREQEERRGLAWALAYMGMTLRDQEDFGLAYSFIEKSIALWRELGSKSGLAFAIRIRGNIALRQGHNKLAQRAFADSLAITRKVGNKEAVARAWLELGQATLCLGDHTLAKTYFQHSFELFREINNKAWESDCLYYFGLLAGFDGETQQAKIFLEQVLMLVRQVGSVWQRANALMGLAGVAAADGQARRAARLLGAADTQLELGASYWDAAERRYIERAVASAVEQLSEVEFVDARADGRTLTFEQAADYALEGEPFA